VSHDYDKPRVPSGDVIDRDDEPVLSTKSSKSSSIDPDDPMEDDVVGLAVVDLSGEDLTVKVIPKRSDEFTCTSCFLVHHRSRMAKNRIDDRIMCNDCAG